MLIYVWDELLYFFKGSYLIRITQWSREVLHRKRLFKEINKLLQERSTFKDTVWQMDKENCFLTEVKSKFLPDFRTDMPKTLSDWFDFYLSGPTVRYISICLVKRHGANRPWYTGTCTFVLDSRLNYITIQVFHIQFWRGGIDFYQYNLITKTWNI